MWKAAIAAALIVLGLSGWAMVGAAPPSPLLAHPDLAAADSLCLGR